MQARHFMLVRAGWLLLMKELYEKVAEFSDHGHMHIDGLPRGKDPRRMPGLNYRMSELTAA